MGQALPNARETKVDRGSSKIANVDPQILRQCATWKSMMNANKKQVNRKTGLVRNYGEDDNRTLDEKMFSVLEDDANLRDLWMKFSTSLILNILS